MVRELDLIDSGVDAIRRLMFCEEISRPNHPEDLKRLAAVFTEIIVIEGRASAG